MMDDRKKLRIVSFELFRAYGKEAAYVRNLLDKTNTH